jgi:hypothetical protein
MESLNQIVLAGKVGQVGPHSVDSQVFKFELTTHQMYTTDDGKQMDPEVHSVRIRRPGTVAQYIRTGKNVVLTGRLKYSSVGSYVLADKIHFPGVDNAE